MILANITQHDAIWVLIILAIIALVLFLVGRWRP